MPRVDILDEPEPMRKPLAGSVALHVSVFGAVLLSTAIASRPHETWGSLNPGGGVVGINVVKGIPMPPRAGIVNPLANDSHSSAPQPPPKPKEAKRSKAPEPDAIALKSRNAPKRQSEIAASRNPYRAHPDQRNQLYSASGPALVSPMMGQMGGGGGVGVGPGGPFGNRFGAYVDILRQRVAEKWRTGDVDPRLQTAPPVIVNFTIMRDGSVKDVRVGQRSGNAVLDYSAQRAIYDASPFPPLPAGYDRNEASIEFWFQLRR